MITRIANFVSPFDSIPIKKDPIVKRIGYWPSVEIDNMIINHDEPTKPLILRVIKMEIKCFLS